MTNRVPEYALLVPHRFNDGSPVPPELRRRIEGLLLDRFDGYTAYRGLDGAWRADDGRVFLDRSDEYRLAAADEPSVVTAADEVGALLRQHAVYLRLPGGLAAVVAVGARRRRKPPSES